MTISAYSKFLELKMLTAINKSNKIYYIVVAVTHFNKYFFFKVFDKGAKLTYYPLF